MGLGGVELKEGKEGGMGLEEGWGMELEGRIEEEGLLNYGVCIDERCYCGFGEWVRVLEGLVKEYGWWVYGEKVKD